jgi:hypothetical protein
MTALVGAFGAIAGVIIGAVGTFLATRANLILTLHHSYDQTLQSKRLERYQELFYVSRCLPRYWLPGEEPTRNDLLEFRERFSGWYFGDKAGGMFLTPASKEIYLRLLNILVEVGSGADGSKTTDARHLNKAESHEVRELASELRHRLAEDVGASNPPRLRWTRPGKTSPPPPGIAD